MLIKARQFIAPEIDSLYMMKLAEIDILNLKSRQDTLSPNSLTKKLLSKLDYSIEANELKETDPPFLIPSKSLKNQVLDLGEELVYSNLELNKTKVVIASLIKLLERTI